MTPDDLELFSTKELIDELMRRTTFQGVVVYAPDGVKAPHWDGERIFVVRHHQSFDVEQAGRLLDVVSQHIAGRE